jgi:hypothetical protein
MSGEVQLCNTSCVLLDAGTLIEFLTPIYQEVVRFETNRDCNSDSYQFGQLPISKLGKETATRDCRLTLMLLTRLYHSTNGPFHKG